MLIHGLLNRGPGEEKWSGLVIKAAYNGTNISWQSAMMENEI